MDESKESVLVRMTKVALDRVDGYANRVGISRNAAIAVLVDAGLGRGSSHPAAVTPDHDPTDPDGLNKARTRRSIARTLQALGTGKWMSAGNLRKNLTPRHREYFHETVDAMVHDGTLHTKTDGEYIWYSLPRR